MFRSREYWFHYDSVCFPLCHCLSAVPPSPQVLPVLLSGGPSYEALPATKCQLGVFYLQLHCYAQASWKLSLTNRQITFTKVTEIPSGLEHKKMSHQPSLSIEISVVEGIHQSFFQLSFLFLPCFFFFFIKSLCNVS